ncbi:TlpA disulfide reductase family protein [Gallaecimonas kandeliae]|uniref:TlpA family protein disulfide reductase n=1 Tax=Gallaecimonas kandeliae TaxID=3029055 RepID=UPI002649071F|nr:TlpA disulfide reductase family protein [Gallaecimonas kandeliae]WKE65107.1 TlpA disulfide reductase family protein [Gallaecimonas kandeliae]
MPPIHYLPLLLLSLVAGQVLANVEEGQRPPSYLGNTPDGQQVQLSERQGKVVVATFWASWCGPCLKEMKVLEAIQRQVGKDRLEIVAINFKEGRRRYRAIVHKLKDFKVTFTHDVHGDLSKEFGVESIPNMFVINKAGLVVDHRIGYNEKGTGTLIDELNKLLTDPYPQS